MARAPFFAYLGLIAAAALAGRRRAAVATAGDGRAPSRFLVVIPAHDEEGNVAATVASCRALRYDPARFTVVVIADNCTDGTAEVARGAGALVVERHDPVRKSKGYALDSFFQTAAVDGRTGDWDAVVVIDADTLVGEDLLDRFDAVMAGGDDWAQAYYTVRNPDASWRTRLLTYAFGLFNGVWLLGQDRLGLSVGFRGNGMLFTKRGLVRVPWQAFGLVEDMEFSWTLRLAGERVRFVPEARVFAEMVTRGKAAVSQRRRWEEGRRSLRARFGRELVGCRALGPFAKILSLIDLRFPSLVGLVAPLAALAVVHPASWVFPNLSATSRVLLPFHLAFAAALGAYLVSPFVTLGLPLRYAFSLLSAPYYAVWKLLVAVGPKSQAWERTQRESTAGEASV